MKVDYHLLAQADIHEALAYYETQMPGTGERFYSELEKKIAQIAESPRQFRDYGGYRRANLNVFPYYIAFTTAGDTIQILAVAHAKRHPDFWKKRMIDL